MIQVNLLAYPETATKSSRHVGVMAAALTGIADTKLAGRDRIEVRFIYGELVTDWLPIQVRDFLHFGHFILALRIAMDDGSLAASKIDYDHLRQSWEPRCDLVERKLCNLTSDCD